MTTQTSTIVNSSYSTGSNGGRKSVRLSNGWIVSAVQDTSAYVLYFEVSKDGGNTWSSLCNINPSATVSMSFAIASLGTVVYVLFNGSNWAGCDFVSFDATTVTVGANLWGNKVNVDSGQNSMASGVSLAVDSTGAIHAAWSSLNSTYPNSGNIRYGKSTNGGSTWTVAQITIQNTANLNCQNPSLVVDSSNYPHIVFEQSGSFSNGLIFCQNWNGSAWSTSDTYHRGVQVNSNTLGTSYMQYNPSAAIDGSGTIHVVWHGEDSTYPNAYNIKYSKSTNSGGTWSAMLSLTTNNSSGQNQEYPTIAIDPTANDLHVFFQGIDTTVNSTYYNIRYIKYTVSSSSWGSVSTLTSNTTANAQGPNALWSEYNENSSDAIRVIYQDAQAGAVKYYAILIGVVGSATFTNQSTLTATGFAVVLGSAVFKDESTLTATGFAVVIGSASFRNEGLMQLVTLGPAITFDSVSTLTMGVYWEPVIASAGFSNESTFDGLYAPFPVIIENTIWTALFELGTIWVGIFDTSESSWDAVFELDTVWVGRVD